MKRPLLKFSHNISKAIYHSASSIALWFRYIGWMYIVGLLGLAVIIYGAYSLAIASPFTKIAFTLSGILVYNTLGAIMKRIPGPQEGVIKTIAYTLATLTITAIPITVYGLILCLFILPWYISSMILFNLVVAIFYAVLEEEGKSVGKLVIWIRNLLNILSIAYLIYQLLILI